MKSRILTTLVVGGILIASAPAGAAGWTSGGIGVLTLASGTDGNLIFTDATFAEGCVSTNAVRVDDSSPNLSRIWALAMMALASNLKVQFYLSGGCLGTGAKATDIRVTAN